MNLRDIAWNWSGLIVNGAVSVVLLPAMIHAFGAADYGMWALLASVISYYGLLDLGLTNSLQRFIARTSTQTRTRQEIVSAALAMTAVVGLIVCGLSAGLAFALPHQFGIAGTNAIRFRNCLLLLGASIAITFPGRAMDATLRGLGRFDISNAVDIVQTVVRCAAILGGIRGGFGIQFAAAVTLTTSALSTLLCAVVLPCADPSFRWRDAHCRMSRVRELCSFSGFVFLRRLGDFMRVQLDTLVIARFLTLALVTPCAVANTLMYYFMLVMSGVLGPITTAISKLDGAQQHDASKEVFLRSTRFTSLLAVLVAMLLIVDGEPLLRLWLGPNLIGAYPLACVLIVAYACDLAQGPSVSILLSRGRHQMLGWWTVAEGIANVALSVYWAGKYGILGVALGTAVPMLFVKIVVQPWYVLRIVGCSATEYVSTALMKPAAVGLVACLACMVMRGGDVGSWPALILVVTAQTVVFCVAGYTIAFTREDRHELRSRVRQFALRHPIARAA